MNCLSDVVVILKTLISFELEHLGCGCFDMWPLSHRDRWGEEEWQLKPVDASQWIQNGNFLACNPLQSVFHSWFLTNRCVHWVKSEWEREISTFRNMLRCWPLPRFVNGQTGSQTKQTCEIRKRKASYPSIPYLLPRWFILRQDFPIKIVLMLPSHLPWGI